MPVSMLHPPLLASAAEMSVAKALTFLVFGFVGVAGGSGIGPGWNRPYIYRHIRYKRHSCHIAIGRQDFRLLTSNGVSVLLYLSHI